MNESLPFFPFPEVKLPDLVVNQIEKLKIGSNLKISGRFEVKKKNENGVKIEVTNSYLINKRRQL